MDVKDVEVLGKWSRIFLILCFCLKHFQNASADAYPPLSEQQILSDEISNSFDDDPKRARLFYPLRGKKPSSSAHFDDGDFFDDEEWKRSHFYPLRGKKEEFEDYPEYKRARGFMPMRGKKVPDDLKRGPSYFMPMRGRRPFEDEEDKRAKGFMPMRGKKAVRTIAAGSNHDQPQANVDSKVSKEQSFYLHLAPKSGDLLVVNIEKDLKDDEDSNKMSNLMKSNGNGRSEKEADSTTTADDGSRQKREAKNDDILNEVHGGMKNHHEKHEDWYDPADNSEKVYIPKKRGLAIFILRDKCADYFKNNSIIVQKRGIFSILRDLRCMRLARNAAKLHNLKFGLPEPRYFGKYPFPYSYFVDQELEDQKRAVDSFVPVRGRRRLGDNSKAFYGPLHQSFLPGIASSWVPRPYTKLKEISRPENKYDWDSVKRAFHATRGKRIENENVEADGRTKRNVFFKTGKAALKSPRRYLALKRPMSFFATRGKRFDSISSQNDKTTE